MTLDLNEISDGDKFEDLVVSYFEDLKAEKGSNIVNLKVQPSGTGTDGGRDILLEYQLSDGITTFNRKWIIQCKFHNSTISTSTISDINIPTLIHSHECAGYLLICKKKATSKLTDLFDRLNKSCSMKYRYEVWSGEQFKRLILAPSKPNILRQYFPSYYDYCVKNNLLQ